MERYGRLTFLAGLILLLTVACTGYSGRGNYTPPVRRDSPPRYDNPAPRYGSSDQRIHDRVHHALDRAPALRNANIGVRVEYGNVYLSGTVYSYKQKKLAHEVAHSVDGVRHVYTRDIRVYH